MFKKNPDLGIMEQAYIKLKSQSTIDATKNTIPTLLTLRRSQSLPTRCAHETADHKCRSAEGGGRTTDGTRSINQGQTRDVAGLRKETRSGSRSSIIDGSRRAVSTDSTNTTRVTRDDSRHGLASTGTIRLSTFRARRTAVQKRRHHCRYGICI